MPYLCLIVERDAGLVAALKRELPRFGFKPCIVDSSEQAVALMRQWHFDAMLIDADDIGTACPQVLRRLHSRSRVPLMLLSSCDDEEEQINSLESGATEIVVKPASARLVAVKLRRLIEVSARDLRDEASEVTVGPLVMHPRRGHAAVGGVTLELTTHQFDLLLLLASRAGEFVPRETIAGALGGPLKEIGRSADVHVYRIRRKLREVGIECLRLDTVYGRGYCLAVQGAASGDPVQARYAEWGTSDSHSRG